VPRYSYTSPTGETTDVRAEELERLVLDFPSSYWRRGSGDASLTHESGATLLVLPSDDHGIYRA